MWQLLEERLLPRGILPGGFGKGKEGIFGEDACFSLYSEKRSTGALGVLPWKKRISLSKRGFSALGNNLQTSR